MIKKTFFILILLSFFLLSLYVINKNKNQNKKTEVKEKTPKNQSLITVVATDLDTPWSIVFLPDGRMITTEREGMVRINGKIIGKINNAVEIGEGGLLGADIDPNFKNNGYVYFYYTTKKGVEIKNRVVRLELKNNKLLNEEILVDDIPGAFVHNGGRIKFGPDGHLYITTGDAGNTALAQNQSSLAGKTLKLDQQKKLTIFSYGHRNSQGLAWDEKGRLFATEHGRSGLASGLDEINIIVEGKNYGWPVIQGDEEKKGMEKPLIHSGKTTWAPAGIAYFKGRFYFGGLRGQALYQLSFVNGRPKIKEYFKNQFGRIRDVVVGPDQMIYFSTSNRDGRGKPKEGDDKIIKVDPKIFN